MATLDSTGFTRETYQDYIDGFISELKASFGAGHITDDTNPAVVLLSLVSDRMALLEEALSGVYQSQFPSTAGGAQLDGVGSLTAHVRQSALPSTVDNYAFGTPGTIVPLGSRVSVNPTGATFTADADVTLAGTFELTNIVSITGTGSLATVTTGVSHGFADGQLVKITGSEITGTPVPGYDGYHFITYITATSFSFTSAETTTADTATISSGTLTKMTSEDDGAIEASIGTLTTIINPVAGWDAIYNVDNASLGRLAETDTEFRVRRIATLTQLAGGTIEAIRNRVLNVDGVTSATIYENNKSETDSDGRPPHSVEVFYQGSPDLDELALAIYNAVSGGVETHGTNTVTVPGTSTGDGRSREILFSTLVPRDIYIVVHLTKNTDPNEGPVWGGSTPQDIRDAVTAYGDSLLAGQDVVPLPKVMGAIGTIDGFTVNDLYVSDSPSADPANEGSLTANVVLTPTQIANILDANVLLYEGTTLIP